MGKKLIRGARVIDPACGRDEPCELLLEGGLIAAVGNDLPAEGLQRR